jgi:cell pole-organizing protein PopZ
MVSESVDAAFGMLAQTEQPHGGRTIEELVTELIRPMLKAWLDDNLPGLVERLVRGSASWSCSARKRIGCGAGRQSNFTA